MELKQAQWKLEASEREEVAASNRLRAAEQQVELAAEEVERDTQELQQVHLCALCPVLCALCSSALLCSLLSLLAQRRTGVVGQVALTAARNQALLDLIVSVHYRQQLWHQDSQAMVEAAVHFIDIGGDQSTACSTMMALQRCLVARALPAPLLVPLKASPVTELIDHSLGEYPLRC